MSFILFEIAVKACVYWSILVMTLCAKEVTRKRHNCHGYVICRLAASTYDATLGSGLLSFFNKHQQKRYIRLLFARKGQQKRGMYILKCRKIRQASLLFAFAGAGIV
jgi:hypothetical protein